MEIIVAIAAFKDDFGHAFISVLIASRIIQLRIRGVNYPAGLATKTHPWYNFGSSLKGEKEEKMPRDPSSGYPYATGADEPLKEICGRRARAGAAYLDKKMPGWREKINPLRLNMAHPNCDIGGQLMGDYTTFYTKDKGGLGYSVEEERDFGFAHCMAECSTLEKTMEYYAALTKAWAWLILTTMDGPDFIGVQNPTYAKKMKP